jgi:hypothetical protein
LKKLFLIFFIILGVGIHSDFYAQSGGRKKERKVKKRGNAVLTQYKSKGHADEFAKGNSGRRGKWSRLFRKDKPAWTYKSSGTARSHYKENRFLFFRHRSQGRVDNATATEKQNKKRARERERGNETFKDRKFKKRK